MAHAFREPTLTCAGCGRECQRTSAKQKVCPECRPALKAKLMKAWRERNPSRAKHARRDWYERNREHAIAYAMAYANGQPRPSLRKGVKP